MGASGNILPQRPISRVLPWIQLIAACLGILLTLLSLIKNGYLKPVTQIGERIVDVVTAQNRQIVAKKVDPSYSPLLARWLHGVQASTILVLLLIQWRSLRAKEEELEKSEPEAAIALQTLAQFKSGWLLMWGAWLGLYVWFCATAGLWGSPVVDAISDGLDVVSGFAIWYCFLVLELPSVNVAGQPHRNKEFRLVYFIALLVGVVCAILGAADRLFNLSHIGMVVGLYNALALAFLTGRLNSHYMKTNRLILLCLYLYTMVQLLYSFLSVLKDAWPPLVFSLALVFKVAVAYAGYDIVHKGGLERYLNAAQRGDL
jgi:hypothetical protein